MVFRALGLFFRPLGLPQKYFSGRAAAAFFISAKQALSWLLSRPREFWAFFPWVATAKWSQVAYLGAHADIFARNVCFEPCCSGHRCCSRSTSALLPPNTRQNSTAGFHFLS
jgi:hypothetical protein